MKRLMDFVWPAVGLAAVAFSSWLLFKELRGLSLSDVEVSLKAISPVHWALPGLSTLLAYAALARNDRIGLAHLGRRVSCPFISPTSATTCPLRHNIVASALSVP